MYLAEDLFQKRGKSVKGSSDPVSAEMGVTAGRGNHCLRSDGTWMMKVKKREEEKKRAKGRINESTPDFPAFDFAFHLIA